MKEFGALLLAGGASKRMGRDKALLPLPDGRLLWQRQLGVLQELDPAELYISGPERHGYPAEVRRLEDARPGLGPLSGIAVALQVMQAPLLVVLAIDLPMMTAAFLLKVLDSCKPPTGRVPRHAASGFYEPLAAVYPQECAGLAEEQLRGGDRSMQAFIREAGQLIQPLDLAPEDETLFANWNEPGGIATR